MGRTGEVFQSLWIGGRLSMMEQLSIRSYLDHGYPFHLYTYGPVDNVPAGTTVLPGEAILPADHIFCYRKGYGKGSFAAFSNVFRYKLLLDRGGWWTDLDSVCTRRMDFDAEHLVGNERPPDGPCRIASGLIKAPPGSPILQYCWDACRKIDRDEVRWGQIGPRLLAEAVAKAAVPVQVLEPEGFYPINYWNVWHLVESRHLPPHGYAIHLWNSRWRKERLDPDAIYAPTCIYEQLKRRFGVQSPPGARRGPAWSGVARHWWRRVKSQATMSRAA